MNYPVGPRLLELIYEKAKEDRSDSSAQRLVQSFDGAWPTSIDLRIQEDPDIGAYAKASIVSILLEAEASSATLSSKYSFYRQILDVYLASSEQERNGLRVVTFNYDRSFEIYVRNSLRVRLPGNEALQELIFTQIKPLHVFGRLPLLPIEMGTEAQENSLEAFTFVDCDDFRKRSVVERCSAQISTIGEKQHEQEEIQKSIQGALRIYLVGMAYHRENMGILGFENVKRFKARELNQIWASGYKTGRASWDSWVNRYRFANVAHPYGVGASDFFGQVRALELSRE